MQKKITYISIFMTAWILTCCKNPSSKQQDNQHAQYEMTTDPGHEEEEIFSDIKMNDINGKPVSVLEEIKKNKLTIIDFWASWCGPCVNSMPHLVDINKKYKDKGLGIIGFSLDEDKNNWEDAVKTLGMDWLQLSDLQGWNNAAAVQYNIRAIPYTMLVSQNGKVLVKELRPDELEETLKKFLED